MQQAQLEAVVGGRFEILRAAGSGGMGVVYQARDRRSGDTVALKVLREASTASAALFETEVKVLLALEHPHIVGYVGHGLTDTGHPYVVMPWLDGEDLQTRLDEGPLSIHETLSLARAVAGALEHLHGRGLIHRDLKPSNLFLVGGDVERVQLIDMGLARDAAAARAIIQSGVLVGTPSFIAPEQARGDRDVSPAVDVFALGCILFECLTGERLFTGAHPMSVLAKILLEDAPRVSEILPGVPAFLDLLVSRMVDKDPAKRPADGTELARWLTETGRAAIPPQDALTSNERRFVTVLVVPRPKREIPPDGDWLHSAVQAFGVRAHVLADRTAIVLAPEHFAAADQACVLARVARHIVDARPDAKVALTTGSATNTTRLPVGQAIDRAVTMVRAPESGPGVRVDDATAALITTRFTVGGGRIMGERASVDPTRRLLGRPTSCLGREGELATLETAFAACTAGQGPKVALVTAEAGAGKSRLRHEFERRLDASAVRILQCRGDPFRASIPYSMVSQLVRRAAQLDGLSEAEESKRTLLAHVTGLVSAADVRRVCSFLGELVDVRFDDNDDLPLRAARRNPIAMADQIGRAFEDILRAWCAHQPVVLVLEDLHWAHGSCVKLLDRTLGKMPGARFCVLALARPEVRGRFPALFLKRDVTEVHLPPLPRSAAAALVREVLGSDVPIERVERIVEQSEGNAFYLEELIRADDRPARPSSPASARGRNLPEAVLAVAQARLERLEPEARKVLRAASVFGDVFWLEGVSALVGQGPAEVRRGLTALVEDEAVAPTEHPRLAGASEFAFRHALLRGTAYATLTDEDRKLGHRLAASWLGSMQEDGELVARHWLEGAEPAQAASAFFLAAKSRYGRSQPDAAARTVARALLLVTAESKDLVPPCVSLLADALTATRAIDAAEVIEGIAGHVPRFDTGAPDAGRTMTLALLEGGLALLRAANHPGLLATLASAATAMGALADFAAARAFLEAATTEAVGDERALPRIRYASATVAFWSGNASSVVELLGESALPEEPPARRQSLLMLAASVVMVGGRAALARGLDLVSEAAAIGRPMLSGATEDSGGEDPIAEILSARTRQLCFTFAAEHEQAAKAADEIVALAQRAGLRYDECAQLGNAAEQYFDLGDRERARALALRSNEIAGELGSDRVLQHNDTLLAYLDRAPERLRQIAEDARADDPVIELTAYHRLGHLLAEMRAPDSGPALRKAIALAHALGVRHIADDCTRILATLDEPLPP